MAEVQAQMFGSLDTTFTALAEVARPFIQESISEGPPTEETAIETLPQIRTLLANSTALFNDLQPAAVALRQTSPTIAASLEAGAPVLAKSEQLNRQLAPTFEALLRLTNNGAARAGITAATLATDQLGPAARFIAPAQTVCNYGGILAENFNGVFTGGNNLGAWQRFIVFDVPKGPNSEGSPSSGIANGGGDDKNFLHSNPYPNTAAPGQTRECEAGNEPYQTGKVVFGNVPGNQGTEHEEPGPEPRGADRGGGGVMALFRRSSSRAPVKRDASAPAPDPRIYGRHYTGPSPWVWGLLVAVLIGAGVYLAFAKKIPFTGEGFTISAQFENATTLRSTSPVRIAGVNVGKVTSVERDGETAKVTFSVDEAGQPIHSDATIEIRPRLFLEGNFFLDLDPGSPSAPVLDDGDTIPVTQTATAVQIDEVLTALQAPARRGLQKLLEGFGTALTYEPTRGRRRRPGPGRRRRDRGRGAERLARATAGPPDATRRSSTRPCWARARTTSRA